MEILRKSQSERLDIEYTVSRRKIPTEVSSIGPINTTLEPLSLETELEQTIRVSIPSYMQYHEKTKPTDNSRGRGRKTVYFQRHRKHF